MKTGFTRPQRNETCVLVLVRLELISLLNSKFRVSPAEGEGLLKKTPQMSHDSKGILFSISHCTSLLRRLDKTDFQKKMWLCL